MSRFKVIEDIGSDSDEEGQVKNVCQLVLRPPGHTGRAKKGHLIFDAAFESGNLGRVDRINDFEYDLFVRPDLANPRFRFWFNFTIENVQSGQRVLLNIVNLGKSCPLFFDGFTPVIRSTSRSKWHRIPMEHVFYYRCPYHRLRFVLTMALSFDNEEDVYQVALSYPYTYTRLKERLNFYQIFTGKSNEGRLEKRSDTRSSSSSLMGHLSPSQQQNRRGFKGSSSSESSCFSSFRLTMSSRRTASSTSRASVMHGRETSRMKQDSSLGLLGSPFASLSSSSIFFKKETIGRSLQNRRIDLLTISADDRQMYWDENEGTGNATSSSTPSSPLSALYAGSSPTLQSSLLSLTADELPGTASSPLHSSLNKKKIVVITTRIHSSETATSFVCQGLIDFLIGSHPVAENLRRFVIFKIFPMISPDGVFIGNTRSIGSILPDNSNCYTLEVSHHGFYDKSTSFGQRIIPYTEEGYMKLGENLGMALAHSYLMIGVIPGTQDLASYFSSSRGLTGVATSGASSSNTTSIDSLSQVVKALDTTAFNSLSIRPRERKYKQ